MNQPLPFLLELNGIMLWCYLCLHSDSRGWSEVVKLEWDGVLWVVIVDNNLGYGCHTLCISPLQRVLWPEILNGSLTNLLKLFALIIFNLAILFSLEKTYWSGGNTHHPLGKPRFKPWVRRCVMSSNEDETRVRCFPSLRLTGRPGIFVWTLEAKGQLVEHICLFRDNALVHWDLVLMLSSIHILLK